MPVGDFLEWLGVAALVAAAALWSGLVLALALAGVGFIYFAQCYVGQFHMPRMLRRRRQTGQLDGSAIWRCDKCGGEHHLGLQAGHVCPPA